MKKIILLFVFTAFLSCETKTIEVNKVGKSFYGDQNELFAGDKMMVLMKMLKRQL